MGTYAPWSHFKPALCQTSLTDGESNLVVLSGQHVVVEEVEPAGVRLLLTQPAVGGEQTGEVGLAQHHPDRQLWRLQVRPHLRENERENERTSVIQARQR